MRNNTCSVVLLELGMAAFDQGGSLVVSKKFDNAIRSYRLLKSGVNLDEIRGFIEKLRSFEPVSTNDASIVAVLLQAGLNSQLMPEDQQQYIQNSKPTLMVKAGFANNEQDAMQTLREFAINLSSSRVKEASEKLDLHIIQSINALDELDKIINMVGARMREWYGLHFPELDNLVSSLGVYAEIVSRAGLRENIIVEILQSIGLQDKKVEVILDAEKALFRALKTGARPPKHGLLFQHPLIHSAPKWQRGKIARAVASKVAIAARIDYYRHNGKDNIVSDKLKIRIDEIREKYREPMPEKERDRKYKEHIQRQQQYRTGRDVTRDKHDKRKKKDRRKRFGKRRR